MRVSEIKNEMSGIISFEIKDDCEIVGAVLDSRLVTDGALFFAVRGEMFDGNFYAADALKSGAAAVIMSDEKLYNETDGNKFLVVDTIISMKEFGKRRFEKSNIKTVAVTGSFGKTGAKEMLKYVFETDRKVYATKGNKNNELGVMLTGCGITSDADILVIEMGTNSVGEISLLSNIVKPDIAIVVSVGHAHVGRFGSFENIITEKLSIANGLKEGGTLIIPLELNEHVKGDRFKVVTFGRQKWADYYITSATHHGMYVSFKINTSDEEFRINHPYFHVAENSLATIAAAQLMGVSDKDIAKGLLKYVPNLSHGNVIELPNMTIIDDTYNAGFESVLRATESLAKINIAPKYAIFGELGEIEGYELNFYDEIASLSEKYPDISFVLCGSLYKKYGNTANRFIFEEKIKAIDFALTIEKGVVVVKASHAKQFGEFIEMLKFKAEENDVI